MRALKRTVVVLSVMTSASMAQAGDWSGVYIGVGGGMGAANHDLSFEPGPALPPGLFAAELSGLGGDGGFFSLGVGADYQVNTKLLVGAFFDYDWTELDTSFDAGLNFGVPLGVSAEIGVEDMWSVGGRIGYIVSPRTLLFMTAGYTHADVSDLTFGGSFGSGVLARVGDFDGYFIGGGAELKITQAISIKGEYRYTDLDSEVITLLPGTGGFGAFINTLVTTKLDPDIQAARVSLNYRFGLGGSPEPEAVEEVDAGSWTQFHLGIGGGYAFANNELTLANGPLLPIPFNFGLDGLGGEGGTLTIGGGYDYQFNSKVVAGVFVDYTMHSADTDLDVNVGGGFLAGNFGFEVDDELSVGARLGYLVTPATLIYGSAGYSRIELSDAIVSGNIGPIAGSLRVASSGSIDGYFLGAGVETKLCDSITFKLDYRYTDGDSEQITLLPDIGGGFLNQFLTAGIDPDIQTIRASLNYRFNFARDEAVPLK